MMGRKGVEPARETGGVSDGSSASPGGDGAAGGHAPESGRRRADQGQRSGGGLERVTVNLIPRASRAWKGRRDHRRSKTDTINRALQVYAYLEEVWSKDGIIEVEVEVEVEVDSRRTELKFF